MEMIAIAINGQYLDETDTSKKLCATAVNALIKTEGKLVINKNCELSNNYNNYIKEGNNQGYGGAIYVKGKNASLNFYGSIKNCSANVGGGAICAETFKTKDDGGYELLDRPVLISGSISGCSAGQSAGAIYIKGAKVSIKNGAEISNSTNTVGKNAIFVEMGTLDVQTKFATKDKDQSPDNYIQFHSDLLGYCRYFFAGKEQNLTSDTCIFAYSEVAK